MRMRYTPVLFTAAVSVLAACSPDLAPDAVSASQSPARSVAPPPPPQVVAVFVVGDAETHAAGDNVNFWGAQWWKNNSMSANVSNGVASFKGYADLSDSKCGGSWSTRPGNSSGPPDAIDDDIAVIVTTSVVKSGSTISGDIKEIITVHQDGNYGPNPGHPGGGTVTGVVCAQ